MKADLIEMESGYMVDGSEYLVSSLWQRILKSARVGCEYHERVTRIDSCPFIDLFAEFKHLCGGSKFISIIET